jgi:acyl-CoA synthetase (AMP-forming)/AMP-acid ligase II
MPTIGQMLSAHARLQPDRIGARDLEREMSFRLWNQRACRLANALLGLGLLQGDRVGVLAWNRIEWLEIYTAAAKAGLVAVPVNFRLVASEIKFILQDCGAAAVIAEVGLHGAIDEIRDDLDIQVDRFVRLGEGGLSTGWRDYEAMIAEAADSETTVHAAPADPWCLMYTSGTTGNPKGAIRGHQGMSNLAMMTEIELSLARRDSALLVMPMCHANSLNFFSAFLYCGAATTVFSRRSFDAELCLRAFAETGATFTSLVPTHYEMMLEVREKAGDLGRVEKLMVSSAPARVETKRRVMEMFPNSGLFELYGSTEAGWVTMLHPDEQFEHLGSVGREVVGSLPIRLLDDAGEEVPDGTPGELYSCGPYAFDGYWQRPDKTAEAFRGDYLSVGDVAVREADGFIRLIDRKKNMIISGGENIYPTEVEAVLAQHPAIRDVAVVGRPDDRWGERVEAAVVLRDGASATSDELIEWSRNRLAGYKRPRAVTFLAADEMPRTATGKIQHTTLRQLLSSRAHRA